MFRILKALTQTCKFAARCIRNTSSARKRGQHMLVRLTLGQRPSC